MSIRTLLVDDQRLFVNGLVSLLEKEADIEVIERAEDGRTAVTKAEEQVPDIVLMDLSMPGLNGIEATRQILSKHPHIKIVVLTMHAERQFIAEVLQAGAAGYLLKDCVLEELVRAIHTVMAGQTYLSPAIAGTVVADYNDAHRDEDGEPVFAQLTGREREVLQLLAEGRSTADIASRLHVSAKTVATHREHIMAKLNIHSIAGLTKYAIREGVTTSAEDTET